MEKSTLLSESGDCQSGRLGLQRSSGVWDVGCFEAPLYRCEFAVVLWWGPTLRTLRPRPRPKRRSSESFTCKQQCSINLSDLRIVQVCKNQGITGEAAGVRPLEASKCLFFLGPLRCAFFLKEAQASPGTTSTRPDGWGHDLRGSRLPP